jgi:hypothetical protein
MGGAHEYLQLKHLLRLQELVDLHGAVIEVV